MKTETIQVTINPGGRTVRWISSSGKIIKYDIDKKCECGEDLYKIASCKILCSLTICRPGSTHTAEILETYTEPRGNIHGRVRIIS